MNEELIEKFSGKIQKLKKKEQGQSNSVHFINDASEFAQISPQNLQEYYDMLEEQQQIELNHNPYYLENTAFYMFHKILCAYNYGLGKKTQAFLARLKQALDHDLNHDQLKSLVEGITQFTSSIVDTLFMSFNFGKEETKQIMPFCRISVEK